jgi:hypothetical protein
MGGNGPKTESRLRNAGKGRRGWNPSRAIAARTSECRGASVNILLFSMPDSFEHTAVSRQISDALRFERNRKFADSSLEEAGFELSVPPERKAFPRALDRFRRPSLRGTLAVGRQTSATWRRVSRRALRCGRRASAGK